MTAQETLRAVMALLRGSGLSLEEQVGVIAGAQARLEVQEVEERGQQILTALQAE